MRSKLLTVILFLLVAAGNAHADNVDVYVESVMKLRRVPGVAVAVVKGGKVVKLKGYGVANLELGVPVTTKTAFEIGSVTKQMTAAAILLLAEDGKLGLDDKISKYLGGTPDSWKDVTIRQLVTHTSGVPSYTRLGDGFELFRHNTADEFIKLLASFPVDFRPGEKYSYSNSGYNLLGFIIEKASGKKYWAFMRERIFLPLGMTHTFDRDPVNIIPNRANGYELSENGEYEGRDANLTDLFSAGTIVSTIEDLVKWDAAWRGDKLLKKSSKLEAWKSFTLNDGGVSEYGFGWNVGKFRGRTRVGHSGSTAGFNSNIQRFIDDDVSVIILTNFGSSGFADTLAFGIAKLYVPSIRLRNMTSLAADTRAESVRNALVAKLKSAAADADSKDASLGVVRIPNQSAEAKRILSYGDIATFELVEKRGEQSFYRATTQTRTFLWRVTFDGKKPKAFSLTEEE